MRLGSPVLKISRSLAFAALLGAGAAWAAPQDSAAFVLQSRLALLKAQRTPLLQIESSEMKPGSIAGDIHAVVDHPFSMTVAALKDPSHWCQILLLHLDTKECAVTHEGGAAVVEVGVVTHYDQPASSAFHASFGYRVLEDTPGFMRLVLDAEHGPLGTSGYRILLEAMPADEGKTFIRMSYSYSYGPLARLALQAYFATFGRGKVGFTPIATEADGSTRYIGGVRGVVERNTMRYFLAVQAYLDSLSAPREGRLEKSLRGWYAGAERYPRQLHEMEEGEYLAMKRREFAGRS